MDLQKSTLLYYLIYYIDIKSTLDVKLTLLRKSIIFDRVIRKHIDAPCYLEKNSGFNSMVSLPISHDPLFDITI